MAIKITRIGNAELSESVSNKQSFTNVKAMSTDVLLSAILEELMKINEQLSIITDEEDI